MGNRIHSNLMNTEMKAAMLIGKMQYPRTQSDWKNELKEQVQHQMSEFMTSANHRRGTSLDAYTLPPSNLALRVTTTDPSQTITNTPVKI